MTSPDKALKIVGVPWYSRQDYPDVLAIMEDRDVLPPTYDEWLQVAVQLLERATAEGVIPVKGHIEAEEFLDWCKSRGLRPNAGARIAFANWVAKAHYASNS